MHRRISFDSWEGTFQSELLKRREEAVIIRRWKRTGVPLDRLSIPLWLYSCTPSKKDMQAALFASDHQTKSLRRAVLDVANQMEQFNKRAAASMFLTVTQEPGILPSYELPSGINLQEVPRLFKACPAILRQYGHALVVGRDLVKNTISDRPLLRGRILQILYFSVWDREARRSPFGDLAVMLEIAACAADDTEQLVSESNLERQFHRFKAAHPKDSKSAEVMAALAKDLPGQWFDLLPRYLFTTGRVRALVPV